MIASFGDQGTQDVFDGVDTPAARRQLPQHPWEVARRKLDMVNAAHTLEDLKVPPGNRLEKLKTKGSNKRRYEAAIYSIRINRLPGCISQGRTRDEALRNVREAIELCLESQADEGWSLPSTYEIVDIAVGG